MNNGANEFVKEFFDSFNPNLGGLLKSLFWGKWKDKTTINATTICTNYDINFQYGTQEHRHLVSENKPVGTKVC